MLSESDVPGPDAAWYPDISEFALTYDAYAALDGFEPVGDLANHAQEEWQTSRVLPLSLNDLRACLFFEQRRWRHFGRDPSDDSASDDWQYIQALVTAIRNMARE